MNFRFENNEITGPGAIRLRHYRKHWWQFWRPALRVSIRDNIFTFAASAIEAATAGETAKTGSTEGESAVPKADAQPSPPESNS